MKSTKRNILDTSLRLFNEAGYDQVTIRMIAQALEMSSGNLNYHFRKREDILEALYFDMVAVFDARVQDLPKHSFTLADIKQDILSSMERMYAYRFFWTDLYNLLRLSDKIRHHFVQVYEDRKAGYHHLFQELEKKDLLKKAEGKNERAYLTQSMINLSNTWLYNSAIYQQKITPAYIEKQAEALLSMLYPYFTDTGKKEFAALGQV